MTDIDISIEDFKQEFLNVLNCEDDKLSIKKSYHKLALIYHPDKPTKDEEKFKKITEAYEMLTNEELLKEKLKERNEINFRKNEEEKEKELYNFQKEKLKEYINFFSQNQDCPFINSNVTQTIKEWNPNKEYSYEQFEIQCEQLSECNQFVNYIYDEIEYLFNFRWKPNMLRKGLFKLKKFDKETLRIINNKINLIRNKIKNNVTINPLNINLNTLVTYIFILFEIEKSLYKNYLTQKIFYKTPQYLNYLEKNYPINSINLIN